MALNANGPVAVGVEALVVATITLTGDVYFHVSTPDHDQVFGKEGRQWVAKVHEASRDYVE